MSNQIETANELIKLEIKKISLLQELRASLTYEQCIYDIVQFGDTYSVFEIATKKEKHFGTRTNVLTWLERRNVAHDKVYNIHKLSNDKNISHA